jgi:hypothetical protein
MARPPNDDGDGPGETMTGAMSDNHVLGETYATEQRP